MQEPEIVDNSITPIDEIGTEHFRKVAKDMCFFDYMMWWLKAYKVGHIAIVTLTKYYGDVKWLRDNVPRMKLGDLDDNRILLQWLMDKYGAKRQKATVLDFKGHIFSALRSAVDDQLISGVPTSQIKANSIEQTWTVEQKNSYLHQPKTLDESEYRIMKTRVEIGLEDTLKKPPYNFQGGNLKKPGAHPISYQSKLMCISFLLHTGCRFSEALGVTGSDVHPDYITLNKTWDYKHNTGFGKTKNDSSIRDIAIDRTLYKETQIFQEWKEKYFPGSDLPILVEPHTHIYNDTYNTFFRKLQKEYNINKSLSVHKIRHTYISYLLNEGVSAESIAKQVGHSDTSMIAKVYGHLLEERAAVDKLKIRSLMR